MDSDLAERYNEGIVPPPDLPDDIPPLVRPHPRTERDQRGVHRTRPFGKILIAAMILSICIVAAGAIVLYVLGGP